MTNGGGATETHPTNVETGIAMTLFGLERETMKKLNCFYRCVYTIVIKNFRWCYN